jgi:hypothetical protein
VVTPSVGTGGVTGAPVGLPVGVSAGTAGVVGAPVGVEVGSGVAVAVAARSAATVVSNAAGETATVPLKELLLLSGDLERLEMTGAMMYLPVSNLFAISVT